jgi:hypothetical protein
MGDDDQRRSLTVRGQAEHTTLVIGIGKRCKCFFEHAVVVRLVKRVGDGRVTLAKVSDDLESDCRRAN